MAKFNIESAYPVRIPATVGRVKLVEASSEEHERYLKLSYRSLIGCLQYLVSGSRPELGTAVQILSKFLNTYGVAHGRTTKRVLRYTIGSQDMGLKFYYKEACQYEKLQIEVYTEANFASEGGDMKSISGFAVFLDKLGFKREVITLYCGSTSDRQLMKHAGTHDDKTSSSGSVSAYREKMEVHTARVITDVSHAKDAPRRATASAIQSVQGEHRADVSTATNASLKAVSRRGIPVRIKKGARVELKGTDE
ncbi:hypothetical protein ON010_g8612 [Phytophthora cinnamomi]|nr:hypothetical protein ON010_g8612 [Phytophthora cinnamomi]